MYDINQRSTNGKKKGNSMSKRNNRSVSNQKIKKQANSKKIRNIKRNKKCCPEAATSKIGAIVGFFRVRVAQAGIKPL